MDCAILNRGGCTAAKLRTAGPGSQCSRWRGLAVMVLARAPGWSFIGPGIELIGLAGTANAADRRPALLDRDEAAIGSAAHVAAINRTPSVRITLGGRRGQNDGRRERRQDDRPCESFTHGMSPYRLALAG